MNYKHIKADEVEENDFGSIVVQNLLVDEEYEKFSVAKVKIVGKQELGSDQESDLAYFVLEGSGTFQVEDETFEVKKGDLVFIPKNTKYKDDGELTLLAISAPRFDRNKRVRFE